MTMVPARNLVQYTGYGGFYTSSGGGAGDGGGGGSGGTHTAGNTTHVAKFELSSDLAVEDPMAEEESRTTSFNEAGSSKHAQEENEEQEVDDRRDEKWLQLGLGSHSNPIEMRQDQQPSRFVELDLFPDRQQPVPSAQTRQYPGESSGASPSIMGPPLFFQHPVTSLSLRQQQPEITWGGPRLGPWTPMPSTTMMPFYSQSLQQQQHSYGIGYPPASFEAGGPSSDIRVIDAPRRPQAGIWFLLQASQNQRKEPTLPQIPKSYLRIKDGRMTVRLLMKYLANKLGLNNESEVNYNVSLIHSFKIFEPYLSLGAILSCRVSYEWGRTTLIPEVAWKIPSLVHVLAHASMVGEEKDKFIEEWNAVQYTARMVGSMDVILHRCLPSKHSTGYVSKFGAKEA